MLGTEFAAAMAALGPFEPSPAIAVAVSGGADSMALAILARGWAAQRGGSLLALVVDHGLRPGSASEARITVERLAGMDIAARLLPLVNLTRGPALAARARTMRYETLTEACRQASIVHLLLGHHASDQVETVMMRVLRGSQTHGLAGMSAVREMPTVRLLRPLLAIEPAVLRNLLTTAGIDWVEDPSNRDMTALRPRLRHRLHMPDELAQAMVSVGRLRAREEIDTAGELGRRVTIRPEGFAVLSPGRIGSAAMSCLIRTVGGLSYPPSPDAVSDLAARPRPATIAGVRILQAGRFGDGWLIVREEAAVMQPRMLAANTFWDNRFRLTANTRIAATVGKLGIDAKQFGSRSGLPSAVLRTLPAVRCGKALAAVPHLGYADVGYDTAVNVVFSPPEALAGPCFMPAGPALSRQM